MPNQPKNRTLLTIHRFTINYIGPETGLEGHISLLVRANMHQFMGRSNQIQFFVRFKADRSLKYLQLYDPFVGLYHDVYQRKMRVSFDLLL